MIDAPTGAEAQAGGVLIVGYGNSLCTDDGVGWAVARRLASDPRLAGVDVRAEHQLTPELAIDASGATLVVLIDAAVDVEPGQVRVRTLDANLRSASAWTHHIGPEGLIALSRELWGRAPQVVVVSIGAASLELGDGLTPVVEAVVPGAVGAVAAVVEAHGGFELRGGVEVRGGMSAAGHGEPAVARRPAPGVEAAPDA
jgi:hydrogenase maturation protease